MGPPRGAVLFLVILAAGVGAAPPVLYWLVFDRVPQVAPKEAVELLRRSDPPALLVDVRPATEFQTSHVDGASNWPFGSPAEVESGELPAAWRGRTLLLFCNSGMTSSLALRALRRAGVDNPMYSVWGGMQAWVSAARGPEQESFPQLRAASGELTGYPYLRASLFEQWGAVVTGFGIKPFYMLLSVLLVIVLWRQRAVDLVALRWGLWWFFIGEAFCAVNYALFGEESLVAEYLHSYGMVLCFGLLTYAVLEGMDLRIVRFSDPDQRCAALGLCRGCIKHGHPACRLQQLFVFAIAAMMVLTLMLLCAELRPVSYNTTIVGTPYNYTHFTQHQLYEVRVCPLIALVLFGASLVALRPVRSVPWSKVLFSAGMGFFGFGLFRMLLLAAYVDNLFWFATWEELTELLLMVGVSIVLWLFSASLLRGKPAP